MSERIIEDMSSDLWVFGGDQDVIGDEDEWYRTILSNPEIIDFSLEPISNIILDDAVRASFGKALKEHYDKNTVEDVKVNFDFDKCSKVEEPPLKQAVASDGATLLPNILTVLTLTVC